MPASILKELSPMRPGWRSLVVLALAGGLLGAGLAMALFPPLRPDQIAAALDPDNPLRQLLERWRSGAWLPTDIAALLLLACIPVLAAADLVHTLLARRRLRLLRRPARLNTRPDPH
jgi:hypothetical protein